MGIAITLAICHVIWSGLGKSCGLAQHVGAALLRSRSIKIRVDLLSRRWAEEVKLDKIA